MEVVRLTPDKWATLSKNANMAVFGEIVDPGLEKIDCAYLILDKDSPVAFTSIQERDRESAYIQYGGTMPQHRGKGFGKEFFTMILDEVFKTYKRVGMLVENTNIPMLRLGMSSGFVIIGMRNFKGSILLEMGREK